MTAGSLYSGVGVTDAGLAESGLTVVWQAEVNLEREAVLRRQWPEAQQLGNVWRYASFPPVDLVYAGFPSPDPTWWLAVMRASATARHWVIVETSPDAMVDLEIASLVRCGWRVRQVLAKLETVRGEWVSATSRQMVIAGRAGGAVVAAFPHGSITLRVSVPECPDQRTPAGMGEWLGVRSGWTDGMQPEAAMAAFGEATGALVGVWIGRQVLGVWDDMKGGTDG